MTPICSRSSEIGCVGRPASPHRRMSLVSGAVMALPSKRELAEVGRGRRNERRGTMRSRIDATQAVSVQNAARQPPVSSRTIPLGYW